VLLVKETNVNGVVTGLTRAVLITWNG
jgi:hypothetical protein